MTKTAKVTFKMDTDSMELTYESLKLEGVNTTALNIDDIKFMNTLSNKILDIYGEEPQEETPVVTLEELENLTNPEIL